MYQKTCDGFCRIARFVIKPLTAGLGYIPFITDCIVSHCYYSTYFIIETPL